MEVGSATAVEYYQRGFEDASELAEKLIDDAKTLEEARGDLRKILATLKDKKLTQLQRELGL